MGMGWDGNLCVGLFYEHRFAMLIKSPGGRVMVGEKENWGIKKRELGHLEMIIGHPGNANFENLGDISTTGLLLQSEAYLKFWHIYSRVLSAQARIKH